MSEATSSSRGRTSARQRALAKSAGPPSDRAVPSTPEDAGSAEWLSFLEGAADTVFTLDAHGRFTYLNASGRQLLALTPQQVPTRSLADVVALEGLPAILEVLATSHRHPSGQCLDMSIMAADGRVVVLELRLRPVMSEGRVVRFEGIARETDRPPRERIAGPRPKVHDSGHGLQAAFDSLPIGIATLGLDGTIQDVNRTLIDMTGLTPDELLGRSLQQFVHPEDAEAAGHEFELLASGRRSSSRSERRFLTRPGDTLWTAVTSALVRDGHGTPQTVLTMLDDITERRHAMSDLKEDNARLSVWVQELEQRTHEIGLLSEMGDLLRAARSPQEASRVTGPIIASLFSGSAGVVSLVSEDSARFVEPAAQWAAPTLEGFGVGDCWALRRGRPHVVLNRRNGPSCRHLERFDGAASVCVPMMAHGELLGVLSLVVPDGTMLSDPRQRLVTTVAEHVSLTLANLKLEATLRSQSIRDPLTGLFNRRYMEESLEREMRRVVRNRSTLGIIMIDIDHFKMLNDVFGHDAGDAMLRSIGSCLQHSIRAEDIACRYGGEEFTLILPEASLQDAAQRADDLRTSVRQLTVDHHRQPLPGLTISAGVALYPDHGPTAAAVLRAADMALYEAKARGRDRVVLNRTGGLFPESMVEYGRR